MSLMTLQVVQQAAQIEMRLSAARILLSAALSGKNEGAGVSLLDVNGDRVSTFIPIGAITQMLREEEARLANDIRMLGVDPGVIGG